MGAGRMHGNRRPLSATRTGAVQNRAKPAWASAPTSAAAPLSAFGRPLQCQNPQGGPTPPRRMAQRGITAHAVCSEAEHTGGMIKPFRRYPTGWHPTPQLAAAGRCGQSGPQAAFRRPTARRAALRPEIGPYGRGIPRRPHQRRITAPVASAGPEAQALPTSTHKSAPNVPTCGLNIGYPPTSSAPG